MRKLFNFLIILIPMIGIGQNLEMQKKKDILDVIISIIDLDLPELVWSIDLEKNSKSWKR